MHIKEKIQIFKLLDSHNNQDHFTDHKEIIKDGSRIIEHADGIYISETQKAKKHLTPWLDCGE